MRAVTDSDRSRLDAPLQDLHSTLFSVWERVCGFARGKRSGRGAGSIAGQGFFAADFQEFFFFRPDPERLPPPSCLLIVAQAMRLASSRLRPRSRSVFTMCSAWRCRLSVYADLSPCGMRCSLLWEATAKSPPRSGGDAGDLE